MFEKLTDKNKTASSESARKKAAKYVQVKEDDTVDPCAMRVTRVEEVEADDAPASEARDAVGACACPSCGTADADGAAPLRLGIDVGSTTVKLAVLDETGATTPTCAPPSSRC